MELLVALLAIVLLVVVLLVIGAPLRAASDRSSAGGGGGLPVDPSPEGAELEAAREAKYREIRDAELDYRTGKLSRADFEAVDGALRAEALEILNRLQAAEGVRAGGMRGGEDASRAGGERREGGPGD